MATDDYQLQASYSTNLTFPNDRSVSIMLNVRGPSAKVFAENINHAEQGLMRIIQLGKLVGTTPINTQEAIDNLRNGGVNVEVLDDEEDGGWYGNDDNLQTWERSTPAPTGKVCRHGSMTLKNGNGAKGTWSAYFCPTPKGTPDQCKPVDAKTGKSWG